MVELKEYNHTFLLTIAIIALGLTSIRGEEESSMKLWIKLQNEAALTASYETCNIYDLWIEETKIINNTKVPIIWTCVDGYKHAGHNQYEYSEPYVGPLEFPPCTVSVWNSTKNRIREFRCECYSNLNTGVWEVEKRSCQWETKVFGGCTIEGLKIGYSECICFKNLGCSWISFGKIGACFYGFHKGKNENYECAGNVLPLSVNKLTTNNETSAATVTITEKSVDTCSTASKVNHKITNTHVFIPFLFLILK
jgi:hypothetical protein